MQKILNVINVYLQSNPPFIRWGQNDTLYFPKPWVTVTISDD